jgi:hypothetical protein
LILLRTLPARLGLVALPLVLSACGSSVVGPSPATGPRVTAITPASGTTIGGTAVTITGGNFAAGASVTIGGAPATQVAVVDSATITAATPQHAAGAGDVAVTVGGQSGTLSGGYTYVAPPVVTNAPPVVTNVTVRGTGPREPAQYATLDETVNVSATVTDAETPLSQLTFAWTADVGTFTGSGAAVTWKAPAGFQTPGTVTLTLTVTERYETTDGTGLPVTRENQTRATSTVSVHDSVREVNDLAVEFLVDFSKQLDPAFVVRNFTPTCGGMADELSDVAKNNRDNLITSYTIGTPETTVDFTGRCPFRNVVGDACAQVPVDWRSTNRATGQPGRATGIDQVTAVLENDRWRLCASDFNGTASAAFRLWR